MLACYLHGIYMLSSCLEPVYKLYIIYISLFADSTRKLQDVLQEFCAPSSTATPKCIPDGVSV